MIVVIGLLVVVLVGIYTSVTMAVFVAGLGALWLLSLVVFPERLCGQCRGSGHRDGPFGVMRTCGNCQGRGRVKRIGAPE